MKYSLVLLVGLVGALGAGCASKPATGGQFMIEQSQATKELGNQWKAGKKSVANGGMAERGESVIWVEDESPYDGPEALSVKIIKA